MTRFRTTVQALERDGSGDGVRGWVGRGRPGGVGTSEGVCVTCKHGTQRRKKAGWKRTAHIPKQPSQQSMQGG